MHRTMSADRPDEITYLPQPDGKAEVWLRKNIEQTEDGWEADEVTFMTALSKEEILSQKDTYFEEEIETTMEDVVEALNFLTNLVLEV